MSKRFSHHHGPGFGNQELEVPVTTKEPVTVRRHIETDSALLLCFPLVGIRVSLMVGCGGAMIAAWE